jgi:protein CpxP
MKKLGRIQTLAVAGLSALALATPVALAQTAGGEQSGEKARAERRGKGGHRGHRGHRGGRGGEFGRGGGRFGGGFRGIELTDAQKASLKQLRQSFGERTKSLREQLHAKRQELRQAESAGTFNEALAAQKLSEAAGLQAKLMAEGFRLRQDSLALLTAEQRTQLEQRRQQREQRRAQRRAERQTRRQTQQAPLQ